MFVLAAFISFFCNSIQLSQYGNGKLGCLFKDQFGTDLKIDETVVHMAQSGFSNIFFLCEKLTIDVVLPEYTFKKPELY